MKSGGSLIIYSMSQFGPGTFQVLNSHKGLVALTMDSAGIGPK